MYLFRLDVSLRLDCAFASMRPLSRKTAVNLLKGFSEKEGNIGPVYPAAINAGPSYYDCV